MTFDYNAKYNPVLKINISDTSPSSVITPVTAAFDKRLPADITINMTLNGNTLTSILNNTAVLAAGTDYILNGNTITLKKEYLGTLSTGTTTLSFVFSAGAAQLLTLSVTDTVPNSVISPDRAVFDKASPADIPIAVTLNGNSLLGIYNGAALLISGRDYTLSGAAVILKKEYLSSLSEGTIRLLFDFSAGKDAEFVITGTSAASGLSLTFYNGTKKAQANTLSLRIKLTNTGNEAIRLSDAKLHYYYTKDGSQSQSFWCDWSHVGSSNVTGNFIALTVPKTGADNYLEIGFTSAAGSLAVNQSIELQIRVAKTDWSNYTQTNDYSFLESADSYVPWEKVTTYVSGILSSGIEP